MAMCQHNTISIDRQAKEEEEAVQMEILQRAKDSRRQGVGGHDEEECQNAQERQELAAQLQTRLVWGRQTESGGKWLAPPTQGHVKKDPLLHPPTYPSIRLSVCLFVRTSL